MRPAPPRGHARGRRHRPGRLLADVACLALLVASAAPAPGQQETSPRRDSDGDGGARGLPGGGDRALIGRLGGFLAWAHPAEEGCRAPAGVTILQTWDEGLWARYRIACRGAAERSLDGVFRTREGEGVWQVYGGFEAPTEEVEKAARQGAGGSRFASLSPPEVIVQPQPELPEEAGRARLIGEAHVELLVDISADGTPLRARPLKGPTPDLGMRRAAIATVLQGQFRPANLAGRPVRYFLPTAITYQGLPPESRTWLHRALFQVEAIVASDPARLARARRRLEAGEAFDRVASGLSAAGEVAGARGTGDWGFVPADDLPAPLREALHQAAVGAPAGPVEAAGRHYLLLKRGEVYYAIRGADREEFSYQIVHQKSPSGDEALRRAVESDLSAYVADSRRRAYMNEAARLMGIRHVRRQVGRLAVHTDVLDDPEIEMLGLVVEAAIRIHEEFWAPILPLRPFREEIQVYAWARDSDHLRLFRLWRKGRVGGPLDRLERGRADPGPDDDPSDPAGEYIPESRILAFSCEEMDGHLPVPIVVHEAVHMLNYERVYGEGATPSHWFDEGLASYFSLSQLDSRLRIQAGEIRRSGSLVQGGVKVQFDPRAQLRRYLESVRDEGPVPLGLLLASGQRDRIWTARPERAYGASWTLIHFLRHGGKGRYREALDEYARLEGRGRGGKAAFERLFGPDLAGLEEAWHRHEETM